MKYPQCRCWCFTLNNWTEEEYEAINALDVTYLVVGKEVGENGTPHLQGFVQFHTVKRMRAVKEAIGKRAHVEPMRSNSEAAAKYCRKDSEYVEKGELVTMGARTDLKEVVLALVDGTDPEDMLEYGATYLFNKRSLDDQAEEILNKRMKKRARDAFGYDNVLLPWQEACVKNLDEQNDRKILFVVDDKGDRGKSWLCEWLMNEREAFWISEGLEVRDIAYAYKGEEYITVDVEKDVNPNHVPYKILERFKNGKIWSTKYHARIKRFPKPKIVVMMNWMPNMHAMSDDRYCVMRLKDNEWSFQEARPLIIHK